MSFRTSRLGMRSASVFLILLMLLGLSGCIKPQGDASLPAKNTSSSAADPSGEPLEIPVDFEELQENNPDIYAWLSMPDLGVEEPILQNPDDDEYYLRRNADRKYSISGSMFTQSGYNDAEFADPVTVIYGHNMNSGVMFGGLEVYAKALDLTEEQLFYIYRPEQRLTYRIFAAVPYNNRHILHYHDFRCEPVYTNFFEDIRNTKSLHANLNEALMPAFGDRVVILSTCKNGDDSSRYLVMGVLVDEANATRS